MPLLVVGMVPWLTVLGWGLVRTWRTGTPTANGFSWQRFALVWSAFVFVFFSASGSKLPSYILPMFPVLAFVTGWLLSQIDSRTLARLVWPVAVAAGAVLAIALAASDPLLRRFVGDEASLVPALAYGRWLAGAAAVATAGCVAALIALRRRTARGRTVAVLAVALSTLVAVQAGIVGYDEFRTTRSSRDILRAAVAANGPFRADAPFFHVHMYDQTVPYYLQRPTTFVEYRDEFALGQDAEPDKAFATERAWIPVWRSLREGYAMMPVSDFERLSAQGLPMRVLSRDPRRVVVSRR